MLGGEVDEFLRLAFEFEVADDLDELRRALGLGEHFEHRILQGGPRLKVDAFEPRQRFDGGLIDLRHAGECERQRCDAKQPHLFSARRDFDERFFLLRAFLEIERAQEPRLVRLGR
jgi:hypothetical protein